MKYYLAIDLGASSGRHIVSHMENNELVLEEVHRFPNGMVESKDGLVWDTVSLFNEIKIGIKKALQKFGKIESLSIDTWGVDYVLLNKDELILPTFAYRNDRVEKVIPEVHSIIPFTTLYEKTGIQFASFNTIYQMYDDLKKGRLDKATDYLMLPEYFSFLLTGKKYHEYTEATTGGFVNLKTEQIDMDIINKLGLPARLFAHLEKPGYFVGDFKQEVVEEVGGNIPVIACPSHDTASAFEAVDCPDNSIIISSGTWSLIGVKLPGGNNSKASFETNFTNEGGVGYIRYLKNIMGMWLANQACKEMDMPRMELDAHVAESTYLGTFDANDPSLNAPKSMKKAILELLKDNPPQSDIDIMASIYRSLAYSYKKASEELENNLGKKFENIYIVGGGAKNKYLDRLTEEITGKHVVALPIEATAIGNIKTQIKRG